MLGVEALTHRLQFPALLLPALLSAFIRAAGGDSLSGWMPETKPPPAEVVVVAVAPAPAASPDEVPVLVPFTCPWAQDGLKKALDGLEAASSGVSGYKIGTRAVQYHGAGEQSKVVDYWQRMVQTYCRTEMMAMPGQDTAFRVVLRDI